MKRLIWIGFGIILVLTSCFQTQKDEPYVVIVSMDGFRWDYPDQINTPNLDMIAANGVRAESIIPCFPTKTFPNHYSMATGLYPDHHGIVLNDFYAPDLDKYYSVGDRNAVEDSLFYFGEPIWVTAERNNVKSASYFWVGSEAAIKGVQPTYWKRYDHSFPFENRIDTVISWLTLPNEKRPQLVMLYFHEPDGIGHDIGPSSPELIRNIEYLDSLVGVLYDKLNRLPIAKDINLIVTSDHGMGELFEDKIIVLEDKLNTKWVTRFEGSNPVFMLDIIDDCIDSAYHALDTVEHLHVWKKGELPDQLNYGKGVRIKDLVVVPDQYWSLTMDNTEESYMKGAHGYDPANKDMHAIFYAIGPDFKENYVTSSFENVNLYPMICKLLNIDGENVDGKIERIDDIFVNEKKAY